MIKIKNYRIDVCKFLASLSMIALIISLIVATIQLETLGM